MIGEIVAGCDFGAPKTAGQQTKKIIYIEATRVGTRHYQISHQGRNERLTRLWHESMTWRQKRRGWTIPELKASVCGGQMPTVMACDFPFSIPRHLMTSRAFAHPFCPHGFEGREEWVSLLTKTLTWGDDSRAQSPVLLGLEVFRPWRKPEFWQKRATDTFCNAQPPLKDKYQNVFSMTLAGNVFLRDLEAAGYCVNLLGKPYEDGSRIAIEAYPRSVAAATGLVGSYKQSPKACLDALTKYMQKVQIKVDYHPQILKFCTTYQSSQGDHDGMDALMCLMTAICYREGYYTLGISSDHLEKDTLQDEGVIVLPQEAHPHPPSG